jgi:hypothetical protein
MEEVEKRDERRLPQGEARGKRMQVNHADPFRGCKDIWYTKNG